MWEHHVASQREVVLHLPLSDVPVAPAYIWTRWAPPIRASTRSAPASSPTTTCHCRPAPVEGPMFIGAEATTGGALIVTEMALAPDLTRTYSGA